MQRQTKQERSIQLANTEMNALASMQGGNYLCRICGVAVKDQEGNTDPRCATMCEPCNDQAVMEVYHQDGHQENDGKPVASCIDCNANQPFTAEVAQCTACYIYFAESTRDGNAARCPECNGDDRIYRTWMTKEIQWLDNVTPADSAVAKHMEEN